MDYRAILEDAFGHRLKPDRVTERSESDPDYADAMAFCGLDWREVGKVKWREHSWAYSSFTPDAWAFYLPSLLLTAPQLGDNNLAFSALVSDLDRSPVREYWDEFFLPRFGSLSSLECKALQACIFQPHLLDDFDEVSRSRLKGTIELLINGA